jgi:hypothetical protein
VAPVVLHYFKANSNNLSNDYLKAKQSSKMQFKKAGLLPKHDCHAIQQIAILGTTIFRIITIQLFWMMFGKVFPVNV